MKDRLVANFHFFSLSLIAAATFFIWYALLNEYRDGTLTVAFLNVGQGDSIFIEAPSGRQVLIDGGPERSVLRELTRVMPFYDRSIDVVIATHSDRDHIGGLVDVLKRYSVDFVFEGGARADTSVYAEFAERALEEGAQRLPARRGQVLSLGGGAYILFLFPDRDASEMEPNSASIIAKLVYKNTSFLLMGDAPKSVEEYLSVIDKELLDADVIKIGHHGSDTSTSDILLGLVSPQYAVISAGEGNLYGHPHREVLDTLARFEIKTLRTDTQGRIVIETDGKVIYAP